ncbi:MAG: hypothetical protein FWG89_10335 [Treponema sp.]|nr:hypothetical protein [Treponema sp.]
MKQIGIILLAAAGLLIACGDGAADKIYLAAGSQGLPGNGYVYGLESGAAYLLQNGRNWYTVQGDGTVGCMLFQLNRPEIANAVICGEFAALDAGVTTITGLDNNQPVNVYKYWKPSDHFLINAWNATGQVTEVVATFQRNTIIDLSEVGKYQWTSAYFGFDVIDHRSEIIFITPDVDNIPQENMITGGSPRIAGGSEWEYRFDGGMANVSESSPLRVKVSASAGQRGYFTLSGEMPLQLTMISKRTVFDYDRPNPR